MADRPGPLGTPIRRDLPIMAVVALALLVPAIANGFPLIFPDSGTYLGIALGHEYAIDRSSFYGLALKPLVGMAGGVTGLWLAIAAQALFVAAVLVAAARCLMRPRGAPPLLLLVPLAWLTSLPWHAGQFMPDALTGPMVLLAVLASLRAPDENGAALVWLGAGACALTHYTHLALLPVVAMAAIGAQIACGLGWRAGLRRAIAPLVTTACVAGTLIAANGIVLQRWSVSPMGSAFLFARLHADGLIEPWLDRHCGRDAPAPLCAIRGTLPRTSQALLWGGSASPLSRHLWQPSSETERWRWAAMLGTANRGAIADQPLRFAISSARGTLDQLAHFQAGDDECPGGCGLNPTGGIYFTLAHHRPTALPALMASRQLQDTNPKALLRAVTTPIAALGLLSLPLLLVAAWRRRDSVALAFTLAISAALVGNAALAGALSDVHDRYQSRIVWLAPLLLAGVAARWRRPCPHGRARA